MKRAVLGLAYVALCTASHADYKVFGASRTPKQIFHGGLELDANDRGVPQQVHIGLTGQDDAGYATGLSVTWYTEGPADCHVQWGVKGHDLTNQTGVAPRKQYLKCSGFHHHAVMGPLVESTEYNYQVVCKPSQSLMLADALSKPLYGCEPGLVRDGLLCYNPCKPGYSGSAFKCWADCPAGYTNDGLTCRVPLKVISSNNTACPWYDKCGLTFKKHCSVCPEADEHGHAYHNDGCTCRVPLKVISKESYDRGVGFPLTCDANTPTQGGVGPILSTKFEVRMHDKPKTVSVFGDMGFLGSNERPMDITGPEDLSKNWSAIPTRNTLENMLNADAYHAVWHVGDVSYADDSFTHNVLGGHYESVYNGYMNWMQNISSRVPYMVAVGNHESECHSPECVVGFLRGKQLANFSAYNARFNMPSQESGGRANMWYSFNYGPAHFVTVNTETDFKGAGEEKKGDSGIFKAGGFGADGEYLAWLEADLAKAKAARDAGKIKFILAGGHRPVGEDTPGLQEILVKYDVDLYFSGHEHSYARSYGGCAKPACTGTVANDTMSYVVVGGAGCEEMKYGHQGPTAGNPGVPFFTAEMSTGFLTFHNATTLEWKLLSSLDNSRVLDSFFLNSKTQ